MRSGEALRPKRPTQMPDHAEVCLRALAAAGLGDKISIGGALGLLHYLDYRPTHDVDAWWTASASPDDQQRVVRVVVGALDAFGQVKTRAWGEVVSVDLRGEGRTVFSFQIARRSAQLEDSEFAPWVGVLLDSFHDLVAAKMVALVERGAPRDFRDIHALCGSGLTAPAQCWALWRHRQELAGGDLGPARARLAVETHLARIAQHRPLAEVNDPRQLAEAEQLRNWFAGGFLDALR